jgi:hypothetical protein
MRIKNMVVALAIWLCLALGMAWLTTQVAAAPAAIVYVDASSGADAPGCGAVGNPCATIKYTIDNVAVANDTIHVATGAYVENITIDKNLTLQGAGAGNTIVDGNATDRVITVTNDAMVTLNGMTIQNGNAIRGGGIRNDGSGTVHVNNSAIYNNTATGTGGGIHNDGGGTVHVNNSAVYDNTTNGSGGGIQNDSSNEMLIVNHSTISGNESNDVGGGIANYGPLTVTNSTINDNTAGFDGGGIFTEMDSDVVTVISNSVINGNTADGNGGGINHYDNGTLNITNSTISGNTADGNGGGVFNTNNDWFNVNHSTISDNTASAGGGIYNDSDSGVVNVKNTIIAGNNDDNCGGYADTITSQGYNVEDADTCDLDQPGDVVDSATVIPFLGPLRNNGGDTKTHALLEGSPAIDAGDPAFTPPPEFDQRSFSRLVGDRLDIGAYEYVPSVGGHTEPVSALTLLWPWGVLAVAVVAGVIGFVLIASTEPQKSGR